MYHLFEFSKNWINTPFRFHGYSKNGCDCIGLIVGVLYENMVLNDVFLKKFNTIKYGNNLSKIKQNDMLELILNYFNEVKEIKEADLLLTKCKNSPIHFIIYEKGKLKENAKIIHTTQEAGRVFISNFDENIEIIKMFCLK